MIQEIKAVPQGWECPKCGTIYAPHVDMCRFCGNWGQVTITATTDPGVVNIPYKEFDFDKKFDINKVVMQKENSNET